MYRREFFSKLGVEGLVATTVLYNNPFYASPSEASKNFPAEIIKPRKLASGDTIGLITPASYVTEEELEKALDNLDKLGMQGTYSENMLVRKGYLGGTDAQRADDVNKMFADASIAGIWCVRGGYGSTRILPYLDYGLIKNNPKPLIGFSDITALHFAIFKNTGIVSYHGPVGKSEFTGYTEQNFRKVLMEPSTTLVLNNPEKDQREMDMAGELLDPYVIRPGVARGRLIGGNLSLVSSLLGTPYDLDMEGKLVFLEEIGEDPYRIDRMLTQLLLAGKLQKSAGIVLGIFKGCNRDEDDDSGHSLSLSQVLHDRLKGLGIPVIYGFSFGHISNNLTLPMGIKGEMDTANLRLKLLESPVENS